MKERHSEEATVDISINFFNHACEFTLVVDIKFLSQKRFEDVNYFSSFSSLQILFQKVNNKYQSLGDNCYTQYPSLIMFNKYRYPIKIIIKPMFLSPVPIIDIPWEKLVRSILLICVVF